MGRYANKVKTIVICGLIVAVILLGIVLFEFVLLKLLGLQYDSFGALVIFFLIYLFLEVPLSLITDNIPKALKTVGIIESSKGWLSFILDIGLDYILIITIDYFMETIMISWQSALLFALISGIISRKLKEDDPEPPMIDSKEYEDLHNEFEDYTQNKTRLSEAAKGVMNENVIKKPREKVGNFMIKNHEELYELLLAKRNSGGSVTCSFKDMNQFVSTTTNEIAIERFLKELGLKPKRIKGDWKRIDQSMAKKILEYILSMNMAYDIELETKPLANMLSNYFLNEFLSNAMYYTNGDFDEDDGFFKLRAWRSITDSTFDTGVLVIDKNNIGILWAEDND